jgi:hypothetical protein
MSDRDELAKLRRLRELESRSSGGQAPRIQPRSNITIGNPFVEFAQGAKGGFDRAAYGLAEAIDTVVPDLPISKETRDGYNQNPVVRGLGLTMPSRDDRQSAINQSRVNADGSTAAFIGDMVSNALPSIATGFATAGGSLLPSMATQAGLSFLTTPGGAGDRGASAAFAAGGEGVGRALPRALSRIVQPIRPTAAADRLIAQGVNPTPGAAAGGLWKRFEDASTSIPGWGNAVLHGQRGAMEQGAQVAMSQGGLRVPAGREGYRQLSQHFDNAFSNATRPLVFDAADPAFDAGVRNIMQQRGLDTAGVDEVTRFLDNIRTRNGSPGGGLVMGDDFHAMLQNLRTEGAAFRKSQDPFQKRVGEAYRDIYSLADNSLSTQGYVNPDHVDAFRLVRQQYAGSAPALKAGELNTVVRNQGVFTPEQYQSSLANNAKRLGNTRSLREGTLPQQQLADDMVEVLGSHYPDSGTATRAMLGLGIPGVSLLADPMAAITAVGAMGAGYGIGRGIYSDVGRRYLTGGLGLRQRQLSNALRNASPYFGTAGATATTQMFNE